MFSLEEAILEWRRQMLAAGIESPVPLEELESHLREEIEQRINSGIGEAEAFRTSVTSIGQAGSLKMEFVRASGFLGWLGDNKTTRKNHVLGALWMAESLRNLIALLPALGASLPFPQGWSTLGFFVLVFAVILGLVGVCGSFYLFRGEKPGRTFIMSLAYLGLFAFVMQILGRRSLSVLGGIFTVFNLVTIWLLRDSQDKKIPTS